MSLSVATLARVDESVGHRPPDAFHTIQQLGNKLHTKLTSNPAELGPGLRISAAFASSLWSLAESKLNDKREVPGMVYSGARL